jgi:TatD DNase family protein
VVDTHAHLSLCEGRAEELVAAAREAGVRRILEVGLDEASNREAIAAAAAHEEVFACLGRHPNSAAGFDDAAAGELGDLAAHPNVRAIGETGLDYYRQGASREEQRGAFEAQIGVAREARLPVVIHLRDGDGGSAVDDAFALLERVAPGLTVILHCFSAPHRVKRAAANGWYCSFAGNLTYPRSQALREAAAALPEELLLLETDAPFLAPQPERGKPNAPANVVATAESLAATRGLDYPRLEQVVEDNARRVFGW